MSGFLIGAIFCVALDFLLLWRIFKGPTAADRMCAADTLDLVSAMALTLYSLHSGRGIYLDVAMVVALLGFVGTVFVARYLEGRM
jgi:multisubunit Na+/H+ antiporter MnhF subunit